MPPFTLTEAHDDAPDVVLEQVHLDAPQLGLERLAEAARERDALVLLRDAGGQPVASCRPGAEPVLHALPGVP